MPQSVDHRPAWYKSWKQVAFCLIAFVLPGLLLFSITVFDSISLHKNRNSYQCKLGYFRCGNGSKCIPQSQWCNRVVDCDNGEDEVMESCYDRLGYIEHFQKFTIFRQFPEIWRTAAPSSCNLSKTYPEECRCYSGSKLKCIGVDYADTFPSEMFAPETTKLIFIESNLARISKEQFSNLINVAVLYLTSSAICQLEPGSFIGMTSLLMLHLDDNNIEELDHGVFLGLPHLRALFLQENHIRFLRSTIFTQLVHLELLDLSKNRILMTSVDQVELPPSLAVLLLCDNEIEALTHDTLVNTENLKILYASNNRISQIGNHTFCGMDNLIDLNLTHNRISRWLPNFFCEGNSLKKLSISENPLTDINQLTFSTLSQIGSLVLKGVQISEISSRTFMTLTKLQYIYFHRFEYCQFAPMVRVCEPRGDGISSVDNLLDLAVLRTCIWIVACVTCLGNVFVLIFRMSIGQEIYPHALFIKNLCAADFIMGIYLVVIASHDVMFRDEYNLHANRWMMSWGCQATGIFALTSCEVSVILLAFMSMERFVHISFPYKPYNLTIKHAYRILICIWIFGLVLALIPLTSTRYFGFFYGSNGVCFPLHIHEPYLQGWQFSAFVFLGLNFVAICIIIFSYVGMFVSIKKTQSQLTAPMHQEVSFAKRFFLIVLTDSLCWIPIIVIKSLAFADVRISDQAYAWLTIFILPINSALNPILYSLSTTTFRKTFHQHINNWSHRASLLTGLTTATARNSLRNGTLHTVSLRYSHPNIHEHQGYSMGSLPVTDGEMEANHFQLVELRPQGEDTHDSHSYEHKDDNGPEPKRSLLPAEK